MARRDLLISVDVEADGPIPGPYSMSSFGAAAFALHVKGEVQPATSQRPPGGVSDLVRLPLDELTFYAELSPISDAFVPEAAAVAGLDRDQLIKFGEAPSVAMPRFVDWVSALSSRFEATPVFVAWPVPYDWMWVYWYLMNFAGSSPFGFSRALDMKAYFAGKTGCRFSEVGKRAATRLAGHARTRDHTHNALDDALEQAEFFFDLLVWDPTPLDSR